MLLNLGYYEGMPVYSDTERAMNKHIALIGASGGGKSVEAQRIISNIIKEKGTVFIVSSHGTFADDQILSYYKDTINSARNDIYAYDGGVPCRMFEPVKFSDGTFEKPADTSGAVSDILSRALSLGSKQSSILRCATDYVINTGSYEKKGFTAIGEALKSAGDKKSAELFDRMRSLFSHNLFYHGDGLIERGMVNVVHLDKLDLETQAVMEELLLSYIWRLANADQFKRQPIYLFIDECQNVMSGNKGTLAQMISEGRRMGINLILATQMNLQGTTNAVQQRISQCGLMMFFRPAANRMNLTAKMISPNDVMTWTLNLKSLKVGDFVALGEFCVLDEKVDYPLVIQANTDMIKNFDAKYYFFDKTESNMCIEVEGTITNN